MGLKFLYTIFTGLLIASFVGFGIASFYTAPTPPETPVELIYPDTDKTPSSERTQLEIKQNEAQKVYEDKMQTYNRNVSMIALGAAVIILVISLVFANSLAIMADGILLGGTLTLFYGIIRGLMTDQAGYRFAVVTVGLIVTLIIGYIKFVKHPKTAN